MPRVKLENQQRDADPVAWPGALTARHLSQLRRKLHFLSSFLHEKLPALPSQPSPPIRHEMAARLRALWEHPAGLKTVFFWAPTMKWGLVLASISDMQRPVAEVSVPQCSALAVTGCVWTRWSFVITPVNPNLALANLFVAATNIYQLSRVYRGEPKDDAVLAIEA